MNVKIVAILSIVLSSVSFHSHALLTDPAEPWTTTWYPYTLDGVPVRDPEGGKQNDATNGGASFTGPSEIASGYTDTEFPCNPAEFNDNGTPTPVGTQCGEKNSAFYFYENGGTVGNISDDVLFLRIRVNSDPQAANGLGFVPNHWNFLLDIEEPAGGGNPVGELDGIKEFWIDLDGNGLSGNSGGIDKLRLVYDNGPDNTAPNEDGAGTGTFPDNICDVTGSNSTTDGTGVVINSYIACHSEGLTGTACYNGTDDLSHARIVAVVDEDPTDLTGEYFIDVQVPVSDLTDNSGCYTNPANLTDPEEIAQGLQLVTDTEQFAIGYSTSDSAQDPLQKDFIFIDGLGDEITTPVTIAFLQASNKGNLLTVDWSTATETSNIGFNIYAIINDEWIKLNSEIIPGALDSLEPLDYQAELANPYGRSLDGVGIAGVDVNGDEDRHGPFAMNRVNGSRPVFSPVNWGQIRRSMKASMDTRASSKIKINQQGPSEVAHLAVPADGLYRVTHQQLKSAGLDLEGTNLNEIAVSFKGIENLHGVN